MRSTIAELSENKSVLESYISQADATWQDSVKTRFFTEHITPLRSEYSTFLSAMEEAAYAFESAESTIKSLM